MSSNAPFQETGPRLVSSLGSLLQELPSSLWSEARVDSEIWDSALLDPARDILNRTGKGLRARLVERSWRLAGGDPGQVPELLPLAIEVLHAGSLVIDDIEDDSRLRRGQPAIHRTYGLPIALNMGNWLYFLALALLSRVPVAHEIRLALYEDVSLALLLCHQGQALDLSVRITSAKRGDVHALVAGATRLKTGSLTRLAALLGARAAEGYPDTVEAIGRFGAELGVGLQMLDDWSGVSVAKRRAKGIEDVRLARPTWPWAWLAETGDEFAYAETVRQARKAKIDWEAELVLDRMRSQLESIAPARIRRQLDTAVRTLGRERLAPSERDEVRDYVDRLERAFG